MRKMKLNLEDVNVESFIVLPGSASGTGSVRGQQLYGFGEEEEIDGGGTAVSCEGTCGKSCSPCTTKNETCSCLASCPCYLGEPDAPLLGE